MYLIKILEFCADFEIAGRCPESVLLPFFRTYFSKNHLDVGVATGYFPATALRLNRASSSGTEIAERQRITLVDLEPATLGMSRARILQSEPNSHVQCVEADATLPLSSELRGRKFDSISLFNLLHCIEGSDRKLQVLNTYSEILSDKGTLYGTTLLGHRYAPNWFSKWWASRFEADGAFHCWNDTKEMIDEALQQYFEESETWIVGYMLLFKARKPRVVGV